MVVAGTALAALAAGCSVGKGTGAVIGTVTAPECGLDGPYSLDPDFFVADAIDDAVEIRIQRGSDWEVYSDGLIIFVHDATKVAREQLRTTLPLGDSDPADGEPPPVEITFFLNETCRVMARRDDTPVALAATGGTISFDSIYAPFADAGSVETVVRLADVTFDDPGSAQPRRAVLSTPAEAPIEFLYNRGRPAQRFP